MKDLTRKNTYKIVILFALPLVLLGLLLCMSLPVSAYGEHWIDTMDEPADYDFSFAIVGDTQIINDDYPDDYHKIYDYILDNRESKNIQMVIGLGDIVNNNNINEWLRASEQFSRLQETGLRHIPIRGNHDNSTNYNTFITEFVENEIAGSYSQNNIHNTYHLYTVGNVKYLILALDYGPSDKVLEWANGVCEQYPDHNVIVATHLYLNRKGEHAGMSSTEIEYNAQNCGEDIWNKLVSKQKNIVMVLSGHISDNGIIHTSHVGEHGNTVVEMLIDPQGLDANDVPGGMVAMFYFKNNGTELTVQYYSTIQEKYYGEAFTVELDTVPVSTPAPTPQPAPTPVAPPSLMWLWISLGSIAVIAIVTVILLLCRRKKQA